MTVMLQTSIAGTIHPNSRSRHHTQSSSSAQRHPLCLLTRPKRKEFAKITAMAPTSVPDTQETKRSSGGRLSQKFHKLLQRADKVKAHPTSKLDDSERFYEQDSPEAQSLALEKISTSFQQHKDVVDQPTYHQALQKLFHVDHGTKLTQCICLGLGSFEEVVAEEGVPQLHDSNTALHQLAVLTVMLRLLHDRHGIQEVIFQDPAFTPIEKAFLQSLGYTVLENPAAIERISAGTFLFAPFLGYPIAARALAVAFPALYIGNGPARYLESLRYFGNHPEEELQWMVNIFERFQTATLEGKPLPSFDQENWTKKTTAHWLSPAFVA